MSRYRVVFVCAAAVIAAVVAIGAAAASPLLAWRDPPYIVAGLAGVIAMALMLFQPLLAAGYLPGLTTMRGRRIHRWVGSVLVVLIVVHVVGLWVTSPPDVIDALLFASPTPFSVWGVIAMWGAFAAATLAAVRRWWRPSARIWRLSHKTLTVVIVLGTVIHAMLIEGTMEVMSKTVLCVMVVAATAMALAS